MPNNTRILGAELVGTAVLILGGPGSAILAGPDVIGVWGIALAFGFSLLVMAYAIGPVSGCHINPAVTVGMALAKKIKPALVPFYIIGQLVGAAVGSVLIYIIAKGLDGFDAENNFAANGWGEWSPSASGGGDGYGLGATIVVEVVFTALLVFVVLRTTAKEFNAAAGGLTAGLTLTLIHLVTIPVDNTSVNPARSFASAIFSGSEAWTQLWAFIVFPLVGAVVGVLIWLLVSEETLEDTMMDDQRLMKARDRASGYVEKGTSRLERGEDETPTTPTTPTSP